MKKTQLERAIESLEAERAVLQLAIEKLRTQAVKAPRPRKPRAVSAIADRSA